MTHGKTAASLAMSLSLGGSVWKVNEDGTGLVRRVSRPEQDAYDAAIATDDAAADPLTVAWSKVYGRRPDPSDAWDHAIKACEGLLWPIVTPKNSRATLGRVIQGVEDKPSKFTFELHGSGRGGVETLAEMLRLMWPNPDRHESGATRPPTQEKAQHVVHLAILVVNWIRSVAFVAAGS